MNRFLILSAVVIIGVVWLAYLFLGTPPIPFTVVLVFILIITTFTRNGINLKERLLNQVHQNERDIINSLKTHEILLNNSQDQINQINRLAFIEKNCIENQKFQLWEKGKRYYQSLPNLLLAFGLLGTFLGVTLNLFLISRKISGEFEGLQKVLPDVIGSMAIAFITSLVALGCSAYLIIAHPSYELDLEKEKLMTSLEHYLDNVFFLSKNQPSVQKKIDDLMKSIDTYSQNISGFVKSLPQNTQRFQEAAIAASNTLTTSSNNFKVVAEQSSQAMQTGANVLSNATQNLGSLTTSFSDLISSLHTSTQSLDHTTEELNNYTRANQNIGTALVNNSSRVQNLVQTNHQNLNNISQQLVENTTALADATQSFHMNATQVTESLEQYTKQVKSHNDRLQDVARKIDSSAQRMMQIQTELLQLVTLLSQSQNP